jgi:hypothetical protein
VDDILDGTIPKELVEEVTNLGRDKLVKTYVEASLIATKDLDAISDLMGLPLEVIQLYHDLYYSVHDLSRIHVVAHIATIGDPSELQMKKWALSAGLPFVTWRMGLLPDYDKTSILAQLCADAVYRSREAFFNGNTADASKEARHWSKHASALIKQLTDIEPEVDEAEEQLLLELEKITESNSNIMSIEDLT